MEKEFIPYEQALALKELGFKQACLSYYSDSFHGGFQHKISKVYSQTEYSNQLCSVPLYQQAFRWFREKYNLIFCNDYGSNEYFYWIISKDEEIFFNNEDEKENVITYKTYEEAELECLKKLIEIVKNK